MRGRVLHKVALGKSSEDYARIFEMMPTSLPSFGYNPFSLFNSFRNHSFRDFFSKTYTRFQMNEDSLINRWEYCYNRHKIPKYAFLILFLRDPRLCARVPTTHRHTQTHTHGHPTWSRYKSLSFLSLSCVMLGQSSRPTTTSVSLCPSSSYMLRTRDLTKKDDYLAELRDKKRKERNRINVTFWWPRPLLLLNKHDRGPVPPSKVYI